MEFLVVIVVCRLFVALFWAWLIVLVRFVEWRYVIVGFNCVFHALCGCA